MEYLIIGGIALLVLVLLLRWYWSRNAESNGIESNKNTRQFDFKGKINTKVDKNKNKPPQYISCTVCGGSGGNTRYDPVSKSVKRMTCSSCGGSGRVIRYY
jgi:DnaJ-class molecular chaperone